MKTTLIRLFKPVLGLASASLLSFGLVANAQAASAIPEGPLVTTEWLADNLNNEQLRIIEVSVNPGVYERGQ